MAFKDQNLALTWVQRHIASFGGDPDAITLFGESAGSFSVFFQLMSPWSSGLVHRAIAQSGGPFGTYFTVQRPKRPRRIADALATRLGCSISDDNQLLSCLKAQSVEDILTNSSSFCTDSEPCITAPWTAVVDYYSDRPFLPNTPASLVAQGQHNPVPVLLGVNSEEGIYSAAKYIFQPDLFDEINLHWDTYGPRYVFDADQPTVQVLEYFSIKYLGTVCLQYV
jgi:carboxylesterase type B